MTKTQTKTHWMVSQDRNYLGHQDLPNGKPVILTIGSAKSESVLNPMLKKTEVKKVIRFKETAKWVKPMICNQTNARMIIKITGENFMEDCTDKKIKIAVSQVKVSFQGIKNEEIDCLRIMNVKQEFLQDTKITTQQVEIIQNLLNKTNKSATDICKGYQVGSLKDLPEITFNRISKRLGQIIKGKV